jgi:atrial natriuretic peptide receptor A
VSNDTTERNERARKAYGALLTVTARTPNNDAYRNFSVEVSKKKKIKLILINMHQPGLI